MYFLGQAPKTHLLKCSMAVLRVAIYLAGTHTFKLYFHWEIFLTNFEGFSKTLANFGTKGRGMLVNVVNVRRLELIVKTKENHNIEQEGKPGFRGGVVEMG